MRKLSPKLNTKLIAGAIGLGLLLAMALTPLVLSLLQPLFGLTIEPPYIELKLCKFGAISHFSSYSWHRCRRSRPLKNDCLWRSRLTFSRPLLSPCSRYPRQLLGSHCRLGRWSNRQLDDAGCRRPAGRALDYSFTHSEFDFICPGASGAVSTLPAHCPRGDQLHRRPLALLHCHTGNHSHHLA
jgi:hypothetical protein